MKIQNRTLWILWLIFSLLLSAWLGYGIYDGDLSDNAARAQARAMFLPNQTSSEHNQIEMACNVCHTELFTKKDHIQKACLNCHEAELDHADDSHPVRKFTDPRNAERIEKLDARYCATCHLEHKPQATDNMGVTLPEDFCIHCHEEIAEERPTHQGLTFDTCASAGCHNYHDNRALYEDYLLRHADDPPISDDPTVRSRDFNQVLAELSHYPIEQYPPQPLDKTDMDGEPLHPSSQVQHEWSLSTHARNGVNCSACHVKKLQGKPTWVKQIGYETCKTCHEAEVAGFQRGKHGMRTAQNLSSLSPEMARLPMKESALDRRVGCNSCHPAHAFDTRAAAVSACLSCHDDQHSLAYKQSKHYRLWQQELVGTLPPGSGVSCATCHLPRLDHETPDYVYRTLVQHNQSDTLRPNEKMIRPVCLQCHNLQDSLNALADPALIRSNFQGQPSVHVDSIDMAVERDRAIRAARQKSATE